MNAAMGTRSHCGAIQRTPKHQAAAARNDAPRASRVLPMRACSRSIRARRISRSRKALRILLARGHEIVWHISRGNWPLTRHLRKAQDREGTGSTHEFKRRRRRRLTAVISTVERPVIDERVDRGALACDRGGRASRRRHVRRDCARGVRVLERRRCRRRARRSAAQICPSGATPGATRGACGVFHRPCAGAHFSPTGRRIFAPGSRNCRRSSAASNPAVPAFAKAGPEAQIAYLKTIEALRILQRGAHADLAGHVLLAEVRRQFPGVRLEDDGICRSARLHPAVRLLRPRIRRLRAVLGEARVSGRTLQIRLKPWISSWSARAPPAA